MKYIAIDLEDKHVLDNRIFDNKEKAKKLAKTYHDQCVSFVCNNYGVVAIEDSDICDMLKFGSFPYQNILYYNEDKTC